MFLCVLYITIFAFSYYVKAYWWFYAYFYIKATSYSALSWTKQRDGIGGLTHPGTRPKKDHYHHRNIHTIYLFLQNQLKDEGFE